ncbi:hypothetical protein NDU88_010490 [Pleurodeles waltl]|uniref:Uncharacterized protein n=1 Tax=Pleurodeles waltl TaxID=8319 RepID=A0AAV7RYC9_PLEWA|nr:hypothetical protein NDU88_010490 [Pleurodeles waltl]
MQCGRSRPGPGPKRARERSRWVEGASECPDRGARGHGPCTDSESHPERRKNDQVTEGRLRTQLPMCALVPLGQTETRVQLDAAVSSRHSCPSLDHLVTTLDTHS